MSSSFKSLDLFGSGPHRFYQGRQGQLLMLDVALGGFTPMSFALGLVELEVFVRGRLIALTESGLWSQRDAITAQLLHPPTPGTLIDLHGRQWTDMSFVRFEELDRTDRNHRRTLGYIATFRRMIAPEAAPEG